MAPAYEGASVITVDPQAHRQFVSRLLLACGVDEQETQVVAGVLLWCDLIGRETQGIWRLPAYVKRFRSGLIRSPCHPDIEERAPALHLVSGNDGFGQYVGYMAMARAIELATQYGVGVVAVRHSNHFGAAAYYAQMAAEAMKLGLVFSNSVPKVAPHGGLTPVLGTNPIAFGAPTSSGESVLVDLSTSASSGSTIMKAAAENRPIAPDIVVDSEGEMTTDPLKAKQGVILPFGGAKGFCLGLMVEILAGVITGAAISHEVASLHKDFSRVSNIGHFFVVVDISKILAQEAYFTRMDRLIGFIKAAKTQEHISEILIPGETRWRRFEQQMQEGIRLTKTTVDSLKALATDLRVSTPW